MRPSVKVLTLIAFAGALVALTASPAAAIPSDGAVADVSLGSSQVHWSPRAEYAGFHLTISGPDDTWQLEFGADDNPSLDLATLSGAADGLYTWELRAAPKLDGEARRLLAAARSDRFTGTERQRPAGLPPAEQLVQSGSFRVLGGAIVQPAGETPERELLVQGAGEQRSTGELGVVTGETVISGDLTVYNSLCVGFDCLNSESYGADTIRLKENNLRIHVDDTSTAASFPRTDWRLEFNSNLNGGGSYFRVIDASASRNIMTLEANAPSNSLYVDDGGRVGFGTQTPSLELHVVDGDTPTLRLAQDTSSGFAAQTWDLAGNETSFFIRDATNGSTLPFRIRPGAASNSLAIDTDDDVGIGVLTSSADLHVFADNNSNDDSMLIEGSGEPARVQLRNTDAASDFWRFGINNAENFIINYLGDATAELAVNQSGDVTISGDLTVSGVKNFATPHPANPSEDLYYVALEGPEAGTYYRGTSKTVDGEAVIQLPEYFSAITETEGMTVQLTSLGTYSQLYVATKSPSELVVRNQGEEDVEFDFFVQGVRRGYLDYQVVRPAAQR